MDYGDIRADSQNPESNGPYDSASAPRIIRTRRSGRSQKPTSEVGDERFGAGFCVTDHHGAGHRCTREHGVTEAIDLDVIDEQAEEENQVGVAVEDGIEKRAEERDAALTASDGAIEKIAESGEHHHAASGCETTRRQKESPPRD